MLSFSWREERGRGAHFPFPFGGKHMPSLGYKSDAKVPLLVPLEEAHALPCLSWRQNVLERGGRNGCPCSLPLEQGLPLSFLPTFPLSQPQYMTDSSAVSKRVSKRAFHMEG